MQESRMNQFKQNTGGTLVQTAPLFASSWAALFSLLRDGLAKGRDNASVSIVSPKSGTRRSH
jgi:hypothetical protein